MPKARIRQHVNPLSRKFQNHIKLPDWNEIYSNLNLPFHLDIGCARGDFLLKMAQLQSDTNFLGIEIRRTLVEIANNEKTELGLTNLYYLFGSMNYYAETLLPSLPKNSLQFVSIQFPDPWFKRRHNKRRVVQPELVTILVDYLAAGGNIFLQSDIEEVALEMRQRFAESSLLTVQHQDFWLAENPLPVPTEREAYVLEDDKPVYRVLFKKES
ncbi:tRNA (guanine-N(7)-)-methyltransferase [Xenococcus sp. PCC 7305]|uniref:tRNA (guanosine(46)-N7)-methyltransferase TrmB n=1 Tax=Xenococcus sp. PCC 7305 TaxID=102125 RepID=UPI0002AC0EC3|nr:tRNA (guanosine(46)-N7)-methyltransferase TrmB [Xenococcus sp. PCC 7305]ELS02497.1 tRNA (guanine-N(7)-)-methyltransferase [Xenococcus sp. PCC 7305]